MTAYIAKILAFKLSVWQALVVTMCAILAPYTPLLYLLTAFVFTDLFLGIWASFMEKVRKKKGKLSIWEYIKIFFTNLEWAGIFESIKKLAIYTLCLIIFSTFEYYFLTLSVIGFTLTKLIAMILCGGEISSILKKFTVITGNRIYSSIFDLFKKKMKDKLGDAKDLIE